VHGTVHWVNLLTVHQRLYQRSGGRLGHRLIRLRFLLLRTTGRRTGQPRTVPLLHLPDGDRVILVASQGGLPTNPQWYGNLVADPKVEIRVGRNSRVMTARTASPGTDAYAPTVALAGVAKPATTI